MARWQGYKHVVGVDEVGRGPIAGPVAVCAFCVETKKKKQLAKLLKHIKDSKKLSEKKREEWYEKLEKARRNNVVDYKIFFVPAKDIDKAGIMKAIQSALDKGLKSLALNREKTLVLLDGGLKAPRYYLHQKSIVHGEDKEKVIAAASVVAKVVRDRQMKSYARRWPKYGFEKHKGYGTKAHFESVKKYGLCPLHRRSFGLAKYSKKR